MDCFAVNILPVTPFLDYSVFRLLVDSDLGFGSIIDCLRGCICIIGMDSEYVCYVDKPSLQLIFLVFFFFFLTTLCISSAVLFRELRKVL